MNSELFIKMLNPNPISLKFNDNNVGFQTTRIKLEITHECEKSFFINYTGGDEEQGQRTLQGTWRKACCSGIQWPPKL